MKRNMKRIISVLMAIVTIICMGNYTYAHSGRTDANGGHRDNNNKSGLGSYHYHCGGHPAHLHTNGVCPYSSSSSSSKSSTSSSSESSTKTRSTVPTTIVVTDIKINENVTSMKEGESQKLTATITPDNATDKNITTINTQTTSPNNNTTTNKKEDSNPLGGIMALGVLGGGGYWGYKKLKK